MMRGNSFANGSNGDSGQTPYRWEAGYQAPRPITLYDFIEPRPGE